MYFDCAYKVFSEKKTPKENLHFSCLHELQELKNHGTKYQFVFINSQKRTENFVSFNGELFQLRRIISW
jgi:hypothetical protein